MAPEQKKYAKSYCDRVPPLLDPDLKTTEERHEKHKAGWYHDTPIMVKKDYFTKEFREKGTPKDYGMKAPCFMEYMPSERVWQKLIKFATIAENPLVEFNPKECKVNPDIPQKRDVPTGIDDKYNDLRVLPPEELTYPDMERDGPAFYDMIYSFKLKKIYCPEAINEEDNYKLGRDIKSIVEAGLDRKELKRKLKEKKMSQFKWNMWEVKTKDIGKENPDFPNCNARSSKRGVLNF